MLKKLIAPAILTALLSVAPAVAKEGRALRVISLSPVHTEVLLRLGARDNIIGAVPSGVFRLPLEPDWAPPAFTHRDEPEKFLAAEPDLILASPIQLAARRQLFETLAEAGIQISSPRVVKASELYSYWRELGALVGRQAEAEAMIADFDRQITPYHQAASARQDTPGVFLEALHQQIKTFTPGSLPVWLVELGGGRSVVWEAKAISDARIIAECGPERLALRASEIDILISQASFFNPVDHEQLTSRKSYQDLPAVKNGRVYQIPMEYLSWPTPSLVIGLEMIAGWTNLELEAPSDSPAEP